MTSRSYPGLEVTERQDFLVARWDGIYVHSAYAPHKEAQRLALSDEIQASDCPVLFGLGLAYTCDAILEAQSERTIVLVEPDPQWLSELAGLRQLSDSNRVRLVKLTSPEDLVVALQELGVRNPRMVANNAYTKQFPELFEVCTKGLEQYRTRFQVNTATLTRFGKLWVRNLVHNLQAMASSVGVIECEKLFAGIPALILAGGPSLDDTLPYLARLKENHLLIAVDTSLRACLAVGVEPDFVVSVDPQYWNFRHFDRCSCQTAILVAESSIRNGSFRGFRPPILMAESVFPLGRAIEAGLPPRGKLGAGGSVATSAWDFARYAGCSEIVFAGLDLSYPGGNTHFKGSLFEERVHRSSHRLRPAMTERFLYQSPELAVRCPAVGGGTVASDRRMDIYAMWFEQQALANPRLPQWRIGEGSRALEGIGSCTVESRLTSAPARDAIETKLRRIRQGGAAAAADAPTLLRKLRDALSGIAESLETLASHSKAAMACIEILEKDGPESDAGKSAFARLEHFDASLIEDRYRRVLGFLVEELLEELGKMPPPRDFAESLRRSRKLYEAIVESAEFQIAVIRPVLS